MVGSQIPPQPVYADIETLNEWAFEKRFPLTKLSFACFQQVLKEYQLLPIGAALGENVGPKLIANHPFSLEEIPTKRVALPGKWTTAHLLFDHLIGGHSCTKVFCRYDEILSLLKRGSVDCGVIIHETRFTFQQAGCVEIVDLGHLWHQTYRCLLPLGGIAIQRNLPDSQKTLIAQTLQASLLHARQYPQLSVDFILSLSQEKDQNVIERHIQTYVNEETEKLSPSGIAAINSLLQCSDPDQWLWDA